MFLDKCYLDVANPCASNTTNTCWHDPAARCITAPRGYFCKCRYHDLSVYWDDDENSCKLPANGN